MSDAAVHTLFAVQWLKLGCIAGHRTVIWKPLGTFNLSKTNIYTIERHRCWPRNRCHTQTKQCSTIYLQISWRTPNNLTTAYNPSGMPLNPVLWAHTHTHIQVHTQKYTLLRGLCNHILPLTQSTLQLHSTANNNQIAAPQLWADFKRVDWGWWCLLMAEPQTKGRC